VVRSARIVVALVVGLVGLLTFQVADAFAESAQLFATSFYSSEGEVLPISLATLSAGTKVKLGGQKPFGIAISPDGGRAFTANLGGGGVSAIETATGSFTTATGAALKSPGSIAVSPDGSQVYVGNVYEDTVAVVDAHTLAVAPAAITVGEWPEAIAFTANGQFAYVANTQTGSEDVSVIDTATRSVVKTITAGLPPFPCRLAVSPRNGDIVVAGGCGAGSGGVSVIDPLTDAATPVAGAGSDPDNALAMAPDGTRAYVHDNSNGDIKIVDLLTDQVESTPLAVGQGELENMVVSHSGRFLYAPRYDAGTISQIDTATGAVKPISTSLGRATAAAITPGAAPAAAFTVGPGSAGAATTFDAGASTTPDGGPATYEWNFGDGTTETTAAPTVSHAFAVAGSYTAVLTVRDDEGCAAEFVYTGQTAVCAGGAQARSSHAFTVPAAPSPPSSAPTTGRSSSTAHCRVPKLHGRGLKATRHRLRLAGCRLGKVRGDQGRKSKVVHQHPAPGRQLPVGAKVTVRVEPPSPAR